MKSKREVKQQAQENIMHGISNSFYGVYDDEELSGRDKAILRQEMSNQMARVEKLFGYIPYEWIRG